MLVFFLAPKPRHDGVSPQAVLAAMPARVGPDDATPPHAAVADDEADACATTLALRARRLSRIQYCLPCHAA